MEGKLSGQDPQQLTSKCNLYPALILWTLAVLGYDILFSLAI